MEDELDAIRQRLLGLRIKCKCSSFLAMYSQCLGNMLPNNYVTNWTFKCVKFGKFCFEILAKSWLIIWLKLGQHLARFDQMWQCLTNVGIVCQEVDEKVIEALQKFVF